MQQYLYEPLEEYIAEHKGEVGALFNRYVELGKRLLLSSELWDEFQAFCGENGKKDMLTSPLGVCIHVAQEAAIEYPWVYLAIRQRVANWVYMRVHVEDVVTEDVLVDSYLKVKERVVAGQSDDFTLEIDLEPFNRGFPAMRETRSIGRGVEFLNRKLSSELFSEAGKGNQSLLHFLRVHQCEGVQLMLNDRIGDLAELRHALRRAEEYLSTQPGDAEWQDVSMYMKLFGFEPGWGRTVHTMRYTLMLLSDILEAPDPSTVDKFLGSVPMIFSILILSPHGYFGQEKVLGLPDTGGQVVYILDQVKALEKEMRHRLEAQGIDIEPKIVVVTRLIPEAGDTTCNKRVEKIQGTANARILRAPFRHESGEVVNHWISRFQIWPFLERFALEVEKEVLEELGNRPDLIVGNYSDGNLVASLLAGRLQVTQCNIAHALEKTKYLYSDLYWKDNEEKYHFSSQFTADLIAMNTADFIITSTFHEIAGRQDTVGQYESYGAFTMPGLFRVVNGINMYDPKFNIVSPGADASVYFPFTQKKRRLRKYHGKINEMVMGEAGGPDRRGAFDDPAKPVIFLMSRLDRIKNIAGFVEWYGRSERLRSLVNVLVVGGKVNPDHSDDEDEKEQIHQQHHLMDEYGLDGSMRWLGIHLEKRLAGELYRFIADKRGAFIQPALFEAFGLTVVEAMSTGLPTFATCYGGPLEIIEDGVSGYHIDPNHGDRSADIIADFFEKCLDDPRHWETISNGAIDRVMKRYTWELYAERMMTLSRIYGFWKFVTNLERDETRRYLEMLYVLQFRSLAESVPH